MFLNFLIFVQIAFRHDSLNSRFKANFVEGPLFTFVNDVYVSNNYQYYGRNLNASKYYDVTQFHYLDNNPSNVKEYNRVLILSSKKTPMTFHYAEVINQLTRYYINRYQYPMVILSIIN
jgi:hypothetical protein